MEDIKNMEDIYKMEKYYKILDTIDKEDINITKLYLLDCLKDAFVSKDIEAEAVEYCYNIWLTAEVDVNLSELADTVMYNYDEICQGKMTCDDVLALL